jgi:hypothetical protein
MKLITGLKRVSRLRFVTAVSVGALFSFFLQSANALPPKRHPRVREVNKRFENQQHRIARGVGNGSLTQAEAANLEAKETALKVEERTFRAEHNGHLTAGETKQLNQQENHLSKQIYQQKHDEQSLGFPHSEVAARQDLQQERIAQGINSGQLTAGEAARLEAREAGLRQQIATDRNANGGKLTDAERKQINEELNGVSAQIYKQKHDAQTQGH